MAGGIKQNSLLEYAKSSMSYALSQVTRWKLVLHPGFEKNPDPDWISKTRTGPGKPGPEQTLKANLNPENRKTRTILTKKTENRTGIAVLKRKISFLWNK